MSIESEWPKTADPFLPPNHPYWGAVKAPHNQFCIDDWDYYHGDGPRGMGAKGDGCVCEQDPNPGALADNGSSRGTRDCPYPDACSPDAPCSACAPKLIPIGEPGPASVIVGKKMTMEFPMADVSQETIDLLTGDRGNMPRLWDKAPIAVTHIAGACIVLFNRYMRQRCEWCGVVLLEYDLQRIAVPAGQDPMPANWPPGKLVRVDGHISAAIDEPDVVDGDIQLPPDACAFDPKTQIK